MQLVNDVLGGNRMLVMVASKDPDVEEPGPDDVYRVGVAGVVSRMIKVPDGTLRILVHGAQRVELEEFVATEPYLVARIEEAPDIVEPEPGARGAPPQRADHVPPDHRGGPYLPEELQIAVANLDDPSELAHMIAGALRIKTEEKQGLLEERDVAQAAAACSRRSSPASSSWWRSAPGSSRRSSPRWTRASASTGCASSSRRSRRSSARWTRREAEAAELREQLERGSAARVRAQAGRARAPALRAPPAAVGGARHDPDLPRVAGHAARGRGSARTRST